MGRKAKARAKSKPQLTTRLASVPSSTTCVATIALASNDQKSATTDPTWMAVSTTSGVEPCSRKAPVVMSCSGRVSR